MEFKVTLKDPDAFYEAVTEAVNLSLGDVADPDKREAVMDIRRKKLESFMSRWIEYGEYVTIVFNDETDTCSVLPRLEK